VDGDCEIDPTWLQLAFEFLEQHPAVGAVSGRLRERHPKASIYNWLCDLEWNSKIGEARSFGGNVMVRLDVLTSVGGYRETLVAGEDPELALRLLRAGWKIWRLDAEMGLHDAAISTFSQWWTRSVRAGYSYAAAVVLHGRGPERYKLREALRGWLWALWIPVLWVGLSVLLWPYGLFAGALYAVQMLKQMYRHSGTLKERAITAAFEMISRFAEVSGQINFVYDRLFKHAQRLIEYK
jgi:GT2 family glycosyltransferase